MKIGLVIYGKLETLSGGYLYDQKLVDYLRSQGDTVEIISLPPASYGQCLSHNFSRQFYKKLRHGQFDVLLQDELNHPSLFIINKLLSRKVHYPIIGIIHHLRASESWTPVESFFYRKIEKCFLNTLDGFIFNSHTTSTTIESLVGSGKPKVIAYPGGDRLEAHVNEKHIKEKGLCKGPLRLLFVGNLIPRKGLHTLVDALANLPRQDWVMDVVGRRDADPPYTNRIKQKVAQLGITNNLTWSANLSNEQLKARYQSSHLLVVPSQYEGFGIVYLEAKGFGLPAIACDTGAAHEIINHGEDGFLIPPDDSNALTQALKTAIDNRELLLQMSLAGLKRFKGFPSWSQSAARTRTFLEALL